MLKRIFAWGDIVKTVILVASAGMFAPSFAAEISPAKPTDAAGWQALALGDLDAMHTLLRDQTPIPYDTENPAYAIWLEEGLTIARSRAAMVQDKNGYVFTLMGYANGFQDPHINVGIQIQASRWPGFIAAWRGNAVIVAQRDALDSSGWAPGTVIESCDGETPAALMRSRLLPFLLPAGVTERLSVTKLFLDFGNPFAALPATCIMRNGDDVSEVTLRWRRISRGSINGAADFDNAGAGVAATWGMVEPVPGVFWIGIPTFFSTDETAPKWRALIKEIKQRGDEMRQARAIVIDTRGNGGGLTLWADLLSDAIFTPKVLKAAGVDDFGGRTSAEVRASPENMAEARAVGERVADDITAGRRRANKSYVARLERAIKRKQPMVRTGSKKVRPSGGMTARRPHSARSPFPAQVYFLSNGSCMSACLMFADQALMVPGVRLVGSSTGSDTPYGAVRSEALPSGLAALTFPQQVFRGRGRGFLESYAADIAYEGNWDDASVRAWTLSLIDAGR